MGYAAGLVERSPPRRSTLSRLRSQRLGSWGSSTSWHTGTHAALAELRVLNGCDALDSSVHGSVVNFVIKDAERAVRLAPTAHVSFICLANAYSRRVGKRRPAPNDVLSNYLPRQQVDWSMVP